MAANVNINRNLSDQFYRYKMPKLVAKVEGKGNGIKTVIVNMPEIAKSLNRPPMYPTKYFGCLLGAQVNFDNKSERYIVNGAHDPNKLQDLLDGFIQKYVLCQSCENPETILSVNKKKEIIGTNCMACGHAGTIPAANDRVAAYILKNPPPKSNAAGSTAAAAAPVSTNNVNSMKNDKINQEDGDDDDEDWGEDTNEDAVRKRMDQLSAGAKSLMLNDDLEKSQDDRLQMFYNYVKEKLELEASDLRENENQKIIKSEADRLDISDKAVTVLCELLLKHNLSENLERYKTLFLRFTHENRKAQKYLLKSLVWILTSEEEQLLPKVATLFHRIYDHEIIEEEVFLEWYKKGQKRSNKLNDKTHEKNMKLIEKAKPFMEWLNNASEESDDEEDNVDVDFDDRIVGDGIKVEQQNDVASKTTTGGQSKSTTKQQVEDEIDIDAI